MCLKLTYDLNLSNSITYNYVGLSPLRLPISRDKKTKTLVWTTIICICEMLTLRDNTIVSHKVTNVQKLISRKKINPCYFGTFINYNGFMHQRCCHSKGCNIKFSSHGYTITFEYSNLKISSLFRDTRNFWSRFFPDYLVFWIRFSREKAVERHD